MATTFKDFIAECEMYPYSRENFELMKECSELALSEKFIKDQIFLAEAREKLESTEIVFEEGYFQESVDATSLEVLTEKYNAKSGSILAKLARAALKVFNTFAKFFAKIGNKFDPITSKGQNVLSKLNSITLDDDKIQRIRTIVDNAKRAEASAFPIKKNQPYFKNIKLKYGGHDQEINELRNDLAVALSDKTVVAEALLDDSGDNIDMQRIGIMDPDDIKNAGMSLAIGKEKEIVNVVKSLYNSWNYVKQKGLVIDVNTKAINKTAEDLQKVCDKIKQSVDSISGQITSNYAIAKGTVSMVNDTVAANQNMIKDAGGSDNMINGIVGVLNRVNENMPNASQITAEINNAVSMITGSIGLTTKVYIQLNAYRQTVINQLYDYLKDVK